ncbi:MAG: DUF3108 domain-containing protein [Saprospiraceae bacterium]
MSRILLVFAAFIALTAFHGNGSEPHTGGDVPVVRENIRGQKKTASNVPAAPEYAGSNIPPKDIHEGHEPPFFASPATSPNYSGISRQVLPADQCSIANKAFLVGEELVYKIYYNWNFIWMSAGELTFRVRDAGSRYHITATGSTYPSYDWFFKVRDKYEVYLDKSTLLPVASSREVEEGGYRLYDKLTFDQASRKVTSVRGKTREVAETAEYNVDPCMHDILSIVYFTRNLEFEKLSPGTPVPIRIFIDKKVWPLRIRYLGKSPEKRIHKLGKFNTLLMSPDVIKGYVFKEDDKLKIYTSDDKNRLPLMIESPISVGSVKAVLKSYNGIRYNLSSYIPRSEKQTDADLPE